MTLNRIKDEIDKRIEELNLRIKILDEKIHQAYYDGKIKQEDELIAKRGWLISERSTLANMIRESRRL